MRSKAGIPDVHGSMSEGGLFRAREKSAAGIGKKSAARTTAVNSDLTPTRQTHPYIPSNLCPRA